VTALLEILSSTKNHSADNLGPLLPGSTVVDQVPVDLYGSVGWFLTLRRSDGQRAKFTVDAVHDGTALADATDSAYELSGGAVTSAAVDQVSVAVVLSGSGISQVLQLVVTVTSGTWSCDVSRSPHVGNPG